MRRSVPGVHGGDVHASLNSKGSAMSRLNSLGAKLAIVFALILPILIWQVGKESLQSFRNYRDTRVLTVLESQNVAANNLIAGIYEILLERLATNNALVADQPASPAVLGEIEKRRSVAVQKISAAFTTLGAQDFPGKAALLGELKAAMDKANGYRTKADVAVKQGKAERDADTVKNLFVSMSELSSTGQKVWGAVLANTSQHDPELARLSNIRLLAWNLRDTAGLERSHVGQAISAKTAIPADKLTAINEIRAQVTLMWRLLQNNLKTDEHPAITKGIQLAKDGYFGAFQPLADQMRKISAEGAVYPMSATQWVDTTTPQLFTLLEIMYGAGAASEDYIAGANGAALRWLIMSLLMLVTAVATVLTSAIMIIRTILRPLKEITAAMRELSTGNFEVAMPGLDRKDEIGGLAVAGEMIAGKIGSAISVIKASTREVTNASAEITTSTTDLSQRTEEQAASLEETSASMEEMTATVKKNAERAQQANQFAASTRTVADRGGEVVAKAVDAMAKIEESSRKIADIIGVIDEIARQTNLLALNAAVEAARAGEAGRGFAVVATEVRSLAQRSSQAAKDITDLITNSNGQVKDGVELVNRAGASLSEIVESIKKVTDIVSDITNSSVEQSSGIEQINRALAQMDEVTQQNSALVEENAATAKALQEQARAMDERVAYFRLRDDAGQAQAAHPAERQAAASQLQTTAARPAGAAPKPVPAATRTAAVAGRRGGPVGRMQAALATAIKDGPA